jgi:hypothetical protein
MIFSIQAQEGATGKETILDDHGACLRKRELKKRDASVTL